MRMLNETIVNDTACRPRKAAIYRRDYITKFEQRYCGTGTEKENERKAEWETQRAAMQAVVVMGEKGGIELKRFERFGRFLLHALTGHSQCRIFLLGELSL
jgi:hypothetical protein